MDLDIIVIILVLNNRTLVLFKGILGAVIEWLEKNLCREKRQPSEGWETILWFVYHMLITKHNYQL